MNGLQKLSCLNDVADYELDGLPLAVQSQRPGQNSRENSPVNESGRNLSSKINPSCPDLPIYMAAANGKRVPILKTVLTSVCERDCHYCSMRSGRDFRRYSFKPEELADTFMQMYRQNMVRGIFLSSGIAGGGSRTQDRILETAEILRFRLGFRGYLHLKIIPGSQEAQVERAMQLADRVSINLETDSTRHLEKLAPHKQFADELLQPLKWVERIRQKLDPLRNWKGLWPSSTTQFVVGPAGETDADLLEISDYLFRDLNLSRTYFARFSPVPGTPLENEPGTDPKRQLRLYQASFLLRDYGYRYQELPFLEGGNLPLNQDPKTLWAEQNLRDHPVEINKAGYQELLRIPGIGPIGARKIIRKRSQSVMKNAADLMRLGIRTRGAAAYILIDGKQLPGQPGLFGIY